MAKFDQPHWAWLRDRGFQPPIPHSIVTEADTWEELRANVREAVLCHFDEGKAPAVIRLHRVLDELIENYEGFQRKDARAQRRKEDYADASPGHQTVSAGSGVNFVS